jgi:hypothetical protein
MRIQLYAYCHAPSLDSLLNSEHRCAARLRWTDTAAPFLRSLAIPVCDLDTTSTTSPSLSCLSSPWGGEGLNEGEERGEREMAKQGLSKADKPIQQALSPPPPTPLFSLFFSTILPAFSSSPAVPSTSARRSGSTAVSAPGWIVHIKCHGSCLFWLFPLPLHSPRTSP